MDLPILNGYTDLEISYCRNCGGFLYKGKYIPLKDFRKAFPKLIRNHLSFAVTPTRFSVDDSVLDNIEKHKNVPILVSAQVDGEEVEEEAVMEVKFKQVECPFCSRLKGGYYEGVLQLRNQDNSQFEEVKNKIKERTDDKDLVAISNEKDVKGGTDFYMTDKKYIQNLASDLHNEYGGELKESPRLFTIDRQSSKRVYRLNVVLRLPDFQPGDIVRWKGDLFRVNSLSADKITAESLVGQKKRPIKIDEAEKVKSKDDFMEAIVTKTHPQTEVLHPKEYVSMPVENELSHEPGKKVKVVEIDGKLYSQ